MLDRIRAEIAHWNKTDRLVANGTRLYWTDHPRVSHHYRRKALIDGLPWRTRIPQALGGPAEYALELGCGSGENTHATWRAGTARHVTGIDLDDSRFAEVRSGMKSQGAPVSFQAADIDHLSLEPSRYGLIYAIQSFHHFERLEHICAEISKALVPGGFFVLDEFVGPARFQWTDKQLALTAQLLGLMPRPLRMYANGIEKRAEGRSTPEQVIQVCPSEAIRSNEIVQVFRDHFDVVHEKNLGGTIQHLLYSGIVQNFPDDDEATNIMVDSINSLEELFIDSGVLPSDFMLLIGRKRGT
ncbi:methyltransferase domain-containing protein [uncultured Paludibaculum sp.]|uniref:class I SAM-dependent methyltransferase n=1 Tax=uncultured Paludibaculum sp. TaxID=1765020 RepID=UPI002AAA9764|nr:methyltransferase domain-containing protein [uncultured Paludibaculum sp.]